MDAALFFPGQHPAAVMSCSCLARPACSSWPPRLRKLQPSSLRKCVQFLDTAVPPHPGVQLHISSGGPRLYT